MLSDILPKIFLDQLGEEVIPFRVYLSHAGLYRVTKDWAENQGFYCEARY